MQTVDELQMHATVSLYSGWVKQTNTNAAVIAIVPNHSSGAV